MLRIYALIYFLSLFLFQVLIPVFALGRAQELCILIETYWDRMNLQVPVYFSMGLTEKANHYYKLFVTWTNQKIRSTFVDRNLFDFKHIKPFDRSYIENPGAMVVFATPGMLHAGLSLQIFKKWAPDENNTLIMPGYCVIGTVGHKVRFTAFFSPENSAFLFRRPNDPNLFIVVTLHGNFFNQCQKVSKFTIVMKLLKIIHYSLRGWFDLYMFHTLSVSFISYSYFISSLFSLKQIWLKFIFYWP